jgi:hypothetical protein
MKKINIIYISTFIIILTVIISILLKKNINDFFIGASPMGAGGGIAGAAFLYFPCARPQLSSTTNSNLTYFKCIGLNENTSDETRNEYKSRMMNIPFYHIHRTFPDLNSISLFLSNELKQLKFISKKYPLGPCYIFIGKRNNELDTWLLFPNFVKSKESIPNLYTIALYHKWMYMMIAHPFYNAPNECGIPINVVSGNSYPTPFSHCPGEPIISKQATNNSSITQFGNVTCNYYTDYYFQPCGNAKSGGFSYPNQEIPGSLPNNYIFAVYKPNLNSSLFSEFRSDITDINRSLMINGQELTISDYTWLISENKQASFKLRKDGLYLYNGSQIIWSFPVVIGARNALVRLEGTLLRFLIDGRTQWQKQLMPKEVTGTSPYILQLSNEGQLTIVDSKGVIFI